MGTTNMYQFKIGSLKSNEWFCLSKVKTHSTSGEFEMDYTQISYEIQFEHNFLIGHYFHLIQRKWQERVLFIQVFQ